MQLEMDCLLVNPEWVRGIFSGKKTAEVRNGNAVRLGVWYGICETGTHIVYGAVKFSFCIRMCNSTDWNAQRHFHEVANDFEDVTYKEPYVWVIGAVHKFVMPLRVKYTKGQVIFMREPEIVEVFKGKQRLSLLTKFDRECAEWNLKKHYIKTKGGNHGIVQRGK